MAKRNWTCSNNPFLAATAGSFEKMRTISTFTDAALNAAGLSTLYSYYHLRHDAYLGAFDTWKASGGQQKSNSATLNELLDGLTSTVNDWDFEIQKIHRKGTAEYLAFFPNGHAPFVKGKQETKIAAVGQLAIQLAGLSPVPAVKLSVDTCHAQLLTAVRTQKGRINSTDNLTTNLEQARIDCCVGLYYVLGALMQQHAGHPEQIANCFNLELIRRSAQGDFTGHTAAQTHETIAKRSLEPGAQLLLKNTGMVPLVFYWANTNNGPIPTGVTGCTVEPTGQLTIAAGELGHPETDKYLSVYNASGAAVGQWELEIM